MAISDILTVVLGSIHSHIIDNFREKLTGSYERRICLKLLFKSMISILTPTPHKEGKKKTVARV